MKQLDDISIDEYGQNLEDEDDDEIDSDVEQGEYEDLREKERNR